MNTHPAQRRPNYGIDAPGVVRNLAVMAVGGLAVMLIGLEMESKTPMLGDIIANVGVGFAGIGFFEALYMVWGSKVGKLRERERLLNLFVWRGDEVVLDAGCGRGLMLNGAARRLTTGRAVGIDLWQKKDQSGNTAEVARANAAAEGVEDKVDVRTGDVRKIPLEDCSVDVVFSSLVLHNIYDAAGRAAALHEIVRVLKPGGRLAILDIRYSEDYARILAESGMRDVRRSRLQFLLFPPVRAVTGTK